MATPIDLAMVASTVTSLGEVVKREYIDPDVAEKVDAMLRQSLAGSRYAAASTAEMLAGALARDLYAGTYDKHLAVNVVRTSPAATPERSAAEADAARALGARRSNYGVRKIEILRGDVGYLDLLNFYRPEEARGARSRPAKGSPFCCRSATARKSWAKSRRAPPTRAGPTQ